MSFLMCGIAALRNAPQARALVRRFPLVASVFGDMGVKFRRHRKQADMITVAKRLPRLLLGNLHAAAHRP